MKKYLEQRPLILIAILLLTFACRSEPASDPPPQPTLIFPTATSLINSSEPETVPTEPALPPATATQPSAIAESSPTVPPTTAPSATNTPEAVSIDGETYRVTFVTEDDVLNVRSGPGINNEVVGSLAPTADNVQIVGEGQMVSGSTWVPIAADDVQGWVNGRFLTTHISEEAFCQDDQVFGIVESFRTAVANQDGTALTQLVHPERGLRIRRHWWNPEIRMAGDDISTLFSSTTTYDWGVADGTGDAMIGSFSEQIQPFMQLHLVEATEVVCNTLINGGSAGIVQLPDGYEQQFFYTFHFPGSAEFDGLDWGNWAVGVELWQGQYYITYLVHFEWEI